VKLKPEQIRLDGGTQPRAVLNTEVMEEYAGLMRAGVEFPPVVVYHDGQDYWLVDGFHRVGAALKAFPSRQIEAEVHQGTLQDAQWASYGVNKKHGLRRTNGDKERAVRAALRAKTDLSDSAIAEHVGVHINTVVKYRSEIAKTVTYTNCVSRTGRDGRTINTARIGKHKRSSAPRPGAISPKAHRPIRGHSQPAPKTALELPHDPEWAARTLISVFDRSFLETLVATLTKHLQGEKA
jgi:hypothetical protein